MEGKSESRLSAIQVVIVLVLAAFVLTAFESHRFGLSTVHLLVFLGNEIACCLAGMFLVRLFHRDERPLLELLLTGWAFSRVFMVATHAIAASIDRSADGARMAAMIVQCVVLGLGAVQAALLFVGARKKKAAGELRLIDDGNRHLWMVFGATALLVIVRIVISYEGQPFEIAGDNNSYENQVVHYSRKGFDPLFWMLSFPHIMITSHYHIATDIPIVHLFRLLIPLSSLTVAAVGLSSLIATRSQSTFARVAGPLFILFFTCMDYVFTDNPSDNWYGPSRNIFPIQALYNPYPEALAVGVWGLVAIFRKQVYALSDLLLILLLFVPMVYFRPFFFYPFVVGFIVYFVLRIINERKLPKQGAKILLVFACGFLVLLIQYQARKHITQGAWANFPDLKPYWGRLQKWTLETYFPRAPHHTLNVILMMPLHWILGLGVAAIVPLRGLFSKRLLLGADDDSKTSWFFLAAFAGYAVPTVFNFVPDVGHVITHFAMTFYLGMAMVFWMDMWDRLEQSRFGTIWQSLVVLQMILVLPYIMFYSTG